MHEHDLKKSSLTKFLPVIEADDRRAELLLREEKVNEFAEVSDTFRLFDLLHRDEYRPLAAIRYHDDRESFVRVYFQRLHETEFDEVPERSRHAHTSRAGI